MKKYKSKHKLPLNYQIQINKYTRFIFKVSINNNQKILNYEFERKHNMKIFKFTLNAGFSKQSFLNYSTEVKANQHIPYVYTKKFKY